MRTCIVLATAGTAACVLALWLAPQALLATYLAAWWFLVGCALGALVNLWLHNLTGGRWGEAVRAPLVQLGTFVPVLALLFLPVLLGLHLLYPWTDSDEVHRWSNAVGAPEFLRAWLTLPFFVARSLAYLLLWSVLAWLTQNPRWQRHRGFAALALLAYAFSVSLAATDWIISLVPLWYSSVFGLLVAVGQALSGLALAVALAARRTASEMPLALRDLGNLLLMYVLTWAYLAFVQYLIIWAENLPHEIAWYLPRTHGAWPVITWLLVVLHFAAPLLILLVRDAKEHARSLTAIAATLLGAHALDTYWQVLPSLADLSWHAAWLAPVTLATLLALVASLPRILRLRVGPAPETHHA